MTKITLLASDLLISQGMRIPSRVQDGTQKSQKVFMNIPTEVGATEAEAIGEHKVGCIVSCT